MPAETQLAMDELAARELAIGRASPEGFEEVKQRWAELRASIAAVIVGDPDDVAMTHSTTDGMNLAVNALPWREGDRVITTRHEHPGGLGPLFALRDRLGVEVEMVDIGDGEDAERTVEAFRTALERPARAIVASHVLWTTGAVLPIAAHRGARPGCRRRDDHRRRPVGRRDPDRHRVAGRRRIRDPRPEVAAGPRGHGRPLGTPRLGGQRHARERRLHLVRVLRPGPAGAPPGRPPVRVRVLPSPVRRRARPRAAGG